LVVIGVEQPLHPLLGAVLPVEVPHLAKESKQSVRRIKQRGVNRHRRGLAARWVGGGLIYPGGAAGVDVLGAGLLAVGGVEEPDGGDLGGLLVGVVLQARVEGVPGLGRIEALASAVERKGLADAGIGFGGTL
jgi:hypothetical protein